MPPKNSRGRGRGGNHRGSHNNSWKEADGSSSVIINNEEPDGASSGRSDTLRNAEAAVLKDIIDHIGGGAEGGGISDIHPPQYRRGR